MSQQRPIIRKKRFFRLAADQIVDADQKYQSARIQRQNGAFQAFVYAGDRIAVDAAVIKRAAVGITAVQMAEIGKAVPQKHRLFFAAEVIFNAEKGDFQRAVTEKVPQKHRQNEEN